MAEEKIIVDVQEVSEEEVEEVKEGKFAKSKNFFKTKGKKVAKIAAVAAVGVGGFALGKLLSHKETNSEGMPIVDVEFYEVPVESEEE